jgi:hypothetical protein
MLESKDTECAKITYSMRQCAQHEIDKLKSQLSEMTESHSLTIRKMEESHATALTEATRETEGLKLAV